MVRQNAQVSRALRAHVELDERRRACSSRRATYEREGGRLHDHRRRHGGRDQRHRERPEDGRELPLDYLLEKRSSRGNESSRRSPAQGGARRRSGKTRRTLRPPRPRRVLCLTSGRARSEARSSSRCSRSTIRRRSTFGPPARAPFTASIRWVQTLCLHVGNPIRSRKRRAPAARRPANPSGPDRHGLTIAGYGCWGQGATPRHGTARVAGRPRKAGARVAPRARSSRAPRVAEGHPRDLRLAEPVRGARVADPPRLGGMSTAA